MEGVAGKATAKGHMKQLNILILGQTGVGKSTWINAFYNHLIFENLEQALKSKTFHSLIPSEFKIIDDNRKLVKISTGKDANEQYNTGQSATQVCKMYDFECSNYLIRLIDTPGIGDTRGVEQDRKNFENVLATVSLFDELHAICILLKPNETRLTVTFRFCVQELLTYLHKDAIQNILFCFTNSRATLFRPGETLSVLEELLAANHVSISLERERMYCYDADYFRYLAAIKTEENITFSKDTTDSFADSWKNSRTETGRMLQHIVTLAGHAVSKTVSLNNVRDTVFKLSRPLAEVARSVEINRVQLVDEKNEIVKSELSIEELKKKMDIKIKILEIVPIDKPKTVCTNTKCTKILVCGKDTTTHYVTECHNPCYLKNVPTEVIAHKDLMNCDCLANTKGQKCKNCDHSYKDHMHIMYDSKEVDKKVIDVIQEKSSEKKIKEAIIKNLETTIAELEEEKKTILEASIQFASILRESALTPYNDAMKEYMLHLIEMEKNQVRHKGTDKHLLALKEYLAVYEAQIQVFQETKNSGEGGASVTSQQLEDVEQLFRRLQGLKHSGKFMQDALKAKTRLQKACMPVVRANETRNTGWLFNMSPAMRLAKLISQSSFK